MDAVVWSWIGSSHSWLQFVASRCDEEVMQVDKTRTESKLISFTEELWEVVDACRGRVGRAAWIEERLWMVNAVRQMAKQRGIRKPKRGTRNRKEQK